MRFAPSLARFGPHAPYPEFAGALSGVPDGVTTTARGLYVVKSPLKMLISRA